MKPRVGYLLDTNAVMSLMAAEEQASAVDAYQRPFALTVVHYAELQDVAGKRGILGTDREVGDWIKNNGIRVLGFDEAAADAVGRLRRIWGKSPGFADICLLAFGWAHKMRVLTRDKDWADFKLPPGLHLQTIGGPKGSRPPPAPMPKIHGRHRR